MLLITLPVCKKKPPEDIQLRPFNSPETSTQTSSISTSNPKPPKETSWFSPQPEGERFAIVYTSNVQGYVEPCGCSSEPLGGIARFASVMHDARKAYGDRVLFIDAGNLLFEYDTFDQGARCQTEAKHHTLLSSYVRLGLKTTMTGRLDTLLGKTYYETLIKQYGLTALVSDRLGQTKMKSDTIMYMTRVANKSIAVVSGIQLPKKHQASHVRAMQKQLQKDLKNARKSSDFVVLLAPFERTFILEHLSVLTDADVIIIGEKPGDKPVAPVQLKNGAWIVSAGMQSQYTGVLEVLFSSSPEPKNTRIVVDDSIEKKLGERTLKQTQLRELEKQILQSEGPRRQMLEKRVSDIKNALEQIVLPEGPPPPLSAEIADAHIVFRPRAIPLERGMAEEDAAADALLTYEKSIPSLTAQCETSIECPIAPKNQPIYVGAETCKTCHASAYDFWRKSTTKVMGKDKEGKAIERELSHGNAWHTLVAAEKDKDRTCIGCHSVGFMQPGGYCKSSDVEKYKDVQCESCHGPGSAHAQTGDKKRIIASPTEETCRTCHHVPHMTSYESFIFDEKLHSILGPGHGDKRKALLPPLPQREK